MSAKKKPTVGITALVPPEAIYPAGWAPLDLNNGIPASGARPRSKLCAWTASWREAVLRGELGLEALVIVAGGDCHNALADGQVAARGVGRSHFFFYPFDGDPGYLKEQLEGLERFLGTDKGKEEGAGKDILAGISKAKELGKKLDRARSEGRADPERTFKTLVSFSDLEGDPARFHRKVGAILRGGKEGKPEGASASGTGRPLRGPDCPRVALIGVPPIYRDFHRACAGAGLQVVFDELPFEFLRLGGSDLDGLARSYSTYTFARPVGFRLRFLKRELAKRKVEGVIHYTQFNCHHLLEDGLFREELDRPMLTIQGDLPGETPAQARLRLEAFGELLSTR